MKKCDKNLTVKNSKLCSKEHQSTEHRMPKTFSLYHFLLPLFLLFLPSFLFAWTQTDWSKGDSQLLWPDPSGTSVSKYWWGSDVDGTDTPDDLYLKINGATYTGTGILFSSWRDAGDTVIWQKISWLSQDAILKKGVDTRGLWYLDEGGNADTIIDYSGGGNNGTIYGATWTDTGILNYPGDHALKFASDSGDSVIINSPSSLYLKKLTVECWVETSSSDTQTIISLGDGETNGWWLGTDGGHFQAKIYTSSRNSYSATDDLVSYDTGVWYHLAFTYDESDGGDTLILYVDGDAKHTNHISNGGDITYAPSTPLLFGDSTHPFHGEIDMVRISTGALSDGVIQQDSIPRYVIFYTRDGDTVSSDTDTNEIPSSGWSPAYLYGNENYNELEVVRWADNFNDDILDTSLLWNKWGEEKAVSDTNLRLEEKVTKDTSGITSRKSVGNNFSLTHYITPVSGTSVSEILNHDTGYLQEGDSGDTGYRIIFDNNNVKFQYINSGEVKVDTPLGNYTPKEEYKVTWERYDVRDKKLIVYVEKDGKKVGDTEIINPDFTPSHLSLYTTSGTAYFDDVIVKPIAQYLQYRAYLKTLDNAYSPILNEVRITFEPVGGDDTPPESIIHIPLKDSTDTDLYRIDNIDGQVTYCFGSPHKSPVKIEGESSDTGSGVDYVEVSWGRRPQGGSWPTSYDGYTWSPWQFVTNASSSGNYSTWQYKLYMENLVQAGYLIRVRAVDNAGNIEKEPTDFTKTVEKVNGDSSLVNMMKDITPPRLVYETSYPKIKISPSWYGGTNGNDIKNIDNRDTGFIYIKDFTGDNIPDTWLVSKTPSFKIWVVDENPKGSFNDCSGLNDTGLSEIGFTDSSPMYAYSTNKGTTYSDWLNSDTKLQQPFDGAAGEERYMQINNIPFNNETRDTDLIRVRVYDRAGNEMVLSDTSLSIDTTPMKTAITYTTASSDSNSAEFWWTSFDPYTQANPPNETQVSDTYLVRWRLINYDTNWQPNPSDYGFVLESAIGDTTSYSNLDKGKTYIFQVRYMDKAGNYENQETWGIGGNTYYWTIESDTPDVNIIQGPAGITSSNTAYFKWRSVGDPTKSQGCRVCLNGTCSSNSMIGSNGVYEGGCAVTTNTPGSYTFSVSTHYSDPTKADTDIRTWIYRPSTDSRAYYPTPSRKFWSWKEGD